MNISGHETEGTPHMSDEDASVEPSLEQPSTDNRANENADSVLARALAAHDRESAAELLVEQHAPAIGRLCMALLGSQAEAEDALQDTLLGALGSIESFRGEGSLRAWLFSIARRCCARRLEARTREREKRRELASQPAVEAEGTERQTLANRARRLLDEMRPTEREAVVLRFSGELSFREVGEACGIDEAAARKRVSRGILRLRTLLTEGES